jgi:glycine/D-amino acid oxidase-like deaminating enzyme
VKIGIVGGGVVGLAAAWNAARAGADVDLFEMAPEIPHRGGASFDQHRLCRIPYGDLDGYAILMAPARAAWERAWSAMGARHYAETGCLSLCTAEGDWTDRSHDALRRQRIAHRILSPAEIATAWPFLDVRDARYGLWTEPGGVLFADRATTGFAELARAAGARLHAGARVAAVDDDGEIDVDGRRLRFDAVLVAAGAWTAALLGWAAPGIVALRQVVVYAEPPAAAAAAWRNAPILLDMGGPRGMFCAPPVAGRGLKFGCGARNAPRAPGELPEPQPGEAEAVLAAWRPRLAVFDDYRVLDARVCWYAATADQRLVAARRGRVVAITGCSGHAYKLAALFGEGLAQCLHDGDETPLAWIRGDLAAALRHRTEAAAMLGKSSDPA